MRPRHARQIRAGINGARWVGDDEGRYFLYYATLFANTRLEVRAFARSINPSIRALIRRAL